MSVQFMPHSNDRPVGKPHVREIDLSSIDLGVLARELMDQPDDRPYLAYSKAVMTGKDRTAALDAIRALPVHRRYTSRIFEALALAFADYDSESVEADRSAFTDLDWDALRGLDFSHRPIQFCLLLKALLGEDEMRRIMGQAIAVASSGAVRAPRS